MPATDQPFTDWPYANALIIANPISGRGQGARAGLELQQGLQAGGVPTELFLTGARGDALHHLREKRDLGLVVAVGGDGTLREVLEGLVDPDTPVGLLPFGTANVLAKHLELPRDVPSCLEVLRGKKLQKLDVLRVNGHLSFLVTGAGLDGAIVHEVERRRRGPISRWSYVTAFFRVASRHGSPRLRVHVDDKPLKGEFGCVLVSNLPSYAGVLRLDEAARLDDGLVEIYGIRPSSLPRLALTFLLGLFRGFPSERVELHRGSRVSIESLGEPVPCQVDGDAAGETPLELVPAANRYRLVVP